MQADKRNKAFLLLTNRHLSVWFFDSPNINLGTRERFKNTGNKAQIGVLSYGQTEQLNCVKTKILCGLADIPL